MSNKLDAKGKRSGIIGKFWNLAVSPVVFVVLSCLWCLDLGIGSIMAFRRDPQFWMKMDSMPLSVWLEKMAPAEMPHSLWVYILVALTWLVAASLVLCTIGWFLSRRARRRTFAEVMLHLGFMLVFAGFIIGSGWGSRADNIVAFAGETVDVPGLGVKLKLGSVEIEKNQRGEQLQTISNVTLLDEGGRKLSEGPARLNHPLIHGETVVYPEGGEERMVGGLVAVPGVGVLEVDMGRETLLPDGRALRVKGLLEPGQRYSRWVGPGAFITVGPPGGPDQAGEFFGDHPLFQRGELQGTRLEWVRPVEKTVAAFKVHRDPGIQLVLFGAVILTLGTFWALTGYLRRTA